MAANDKTPKDTTPTKKVARVESYDIARSDETLDLAKDLAKFILENKLSTQVQGKEFVNVEGWQYAGSRLGIVPIVEHVINCSTEHELKYQAKVTLFDMRSQHTVGAGFAICSNKESGKKFYQEFAIASMAQTRAIGKAYRNILAWIIRAAGYEPTPAEEMEYTGNVPSMAAPVASVPPPTQAAQPETVPMSVSGGGTEPAVPVVVEYARAEQKAEIIRLLNHPLITRQEKTKMLLNINRLDKERADQAITKLRKVIEDREGTSAAAESAGNAPAGAPSATPAASPSDAPADSTGSDQNAGFSSPEVVALATELAQFKSTLDLKEFWNKLTGGQRKELLPLKEAKQKEILATIHAASATASRQNGGAMREVGTDSALVDEFVKEPKVAGAPYGPAGKEQREQLIILLNDPRITLKEKTALLVAIPDLDTERARLASKAVSDAINQRKAVAQQAQVAALAERGTGEVANQEELQVA